MNDFSNAIATGSERFHELSSKALFQKVDDQTCRHLAGALLAIALGGFVVGRLYLIADLLVKSARSAGSSDRTEAAPSKMILSSGEEIGCRWAVLSREFLAAGEGLLAGVVPQASAGALPVFADQFDECKLIISRISIADSDATELAGKKFTALQFVGVAGILYGALSDNEGVVARLRSDRSIRQLYDRFKRIARDETLPTLPEVTAPVMSYLSGKARELSEAARELLTEKP